MYTRTIDHTKEPLCETCGKADCECEMLSGCCGAPMVENSELDDVTGACCKCKQWAGFEKVKP